MTLDCSADRSIVISIACRRNPDYSGRNPHGYHIRCIAWIQPHHRHGPDAPFHIYHGTHGGHDPVFFHNGVGSLWRIHSGNPAKHAWNHTKRMHLSGRLSPGSARSGSKSYFDIGYFFSYWMYLWAGDAVDCHSHYPAISTGF